MLFLVSPNNRGYIDKITSFSNRELVVIDVKSPFLILNNKKVNSMSTSMRGYLLYFSAFLLIASIGSIANQSLAGDGKTTKLDKYGVEVTLPDRWEAKVVNKTVKGKLVIAMEIRDKRDMQKNILYVRPVKVKKGKEVPIEKWVEKGQVPKFFKGYAEGLRYTYEPKSESQVTTKSGEQVPVKYYQAYIGSGHAREVAFSYLVHKGHYLLLITMNTGIMVKNAPFVEKSLLPNLVLY